MPLPHVIHVNWLISCRMNHFVCGRSGKDGMTRWWDGKMWDVRALVSLFVWVGGCAWCCSCGGVCEQTLCMSHPYIASCAVCILHGCHQPHDQLLQMRTYHGKYVQYLIEVVLYCHVKVLRYALLSCRCYVMLCHVMPCHIMIVFQSSLCSMGSCLFHCPHTTANHHHTGEHTNCSHAMLCCALLCCALLWRYVT